MGAFPYIWLLFNTTIGRVILVLLVVYVIIYVFNWWTLLIVAVILMPFSKDLYLEFKKSKKQKKMKKARAQKQRELLAQLKEKYPEAVVTEYKNRGDVTRKVHWLSIGRDKGDNYEFDNKIFKVKFTITDDLSGLNVTITNTSLEAYDFDWSSFLINKGRVFIDGIHYQDYKEDGRLEEGETVSKMTKRISDSLLKDRTIVDFDIVFKDGEKKSFRITLYMNVVDVSE